MKKYRTPILLFAIFEIIAVSLWLSTGNLFFLLNFSYIGICLGVGGILMTAGWKHAREFVQFTVGSYILVFLGLICRENMQMEGFWYYLLSGVVGAGVLHYLIAKIFGPLLFGRGWCGFACWTAMILDLLPYKQPAKPRKSFGWVRYVMFAQDNRAFCKYICPITVFLKPMSYYSLLRIKCDEAKCIHCDKCLKVCPMEVEVNNNSRKRKNATECILCQQCKKACPVGALK